ncbi:oligosaccharide flippase family protein [Fulvivirga sp. 29W222]|uniref:Oligosaccharide flippase family protein n=1 Tax=Fulvivirga marina TaxID=2494733 RepID=A0A937KBG2_9BACT|nr:oligosaccharide flippase family protein [Fulvivirga marina]
MGFLIGFAFTPLIARVYQPEAYGLFALFNAFASNITIISTLNLTNAFILPKNNATFYALFKFTIFSVAITTIISFLAFLFLGQWILEAFNATELGAFALLIPVFVFLSAISQVLNAWNVRIKAFARSATSKAGSIAVAKSTTLGYGYMTDGFIGGLIIGEFINVLANSLILLSRRIRRKMILIFKQKSLPVAAAISEYREYPLYALPANWLYACADQVPIYGLTYYYGAESTGYFSFAYSLLNIPLLLIGQSTATVFLQKAAETDQAEPGKLQGITVQLFNRLIYFGLIPFAILGVFGDYIFSVFLGEEWTKAGVFASYLGPYFMFRLVVFPIMSIYRVKRKEKTFLRYAAASLMVLLLVLFLSVQIFSVDGFIVAFSTFAALNHIVLAILIFRMLNVTNIVTIMIKVVLIVLSTFALLFAFRFFILYLI